jgi:hypothetical protein
MATANRASGSRGDGVSLGERAVWVNVLCFPRFGRLKQYSPLRRIAQIEAMLRRAKSSDVRGSRQPMTETLSAAAAGVPVKESI